MSKIKKSETTKTSAPGSKEASPSSAPTAQDFEKLGLFYLGRPFDLATKTPLPGWLLYDSKDLVTHAVCVGMTGSGKTGLCLALLEEAAIDGIPALIIDPKGDLGNLLLTFPELRAQDFEPWINEDEARKKGLSPADYAAKQAETWKNGLAKWGQDGERIARLRASADFAIYTPGSHAGLPVSILKSFAAPEEGIRGEAELLRERINTTATSLLGLLGIEADPIKSREHILLSTILDVAWRKGQDLDLAALIHQIQAPPVSKVGVMDLESFYPAKDRFALAMQLNNLLAAPGFASWMEGEALELSSLLYTPEGKPRMAIMSIAHLSEAERMFFVSLLLNQALGWVRAQSGTTSLRALIYMDEIFGYFPPVANPPSKGPLLTLLKQARAFGVGVVLATQNPVDLDYKGLANTGTWFIGRLQTERDKARVLEGLEGASAGSGQRFDRKRMEETLAGLGNRIFLMNNVHEDEPVIFETRWALSYLRGPLTRTQIKSLMDPVRRQTSSVMRQPGGKAESDSLRMTNDGLRMTASRPVLPPGVPQYFVPMRGTRPSGSQLVYRPMVLGLSQIRFADAKKGLEAIHDEAHVMPADRAAATLDWERSEAISIVQDDLEREPNSEARFEEIATAAGQPKSYDEWKRDYSNWLFRTAKLDLYRSPRLSELSKPGESERDFRVRLQQVAHERRDAAADKLRQKYAPKIAALQERLRRAEQAVEREKEQAKQTGLQTALSVGATILGAFMGRKSISATTIGKATTALGKAGRTMKDMKDVGMAQDNVAALQQQLADLEAQFKSETDQLSAFDPQSEPLETLALRPTKTNIAVKLVALAWLPDWQDAQGALTPAWE
ncbi:ATP-binding protein [Nitrospira tepida]|uniref:ATP-binding protein n=1 Tax=Nitrospira tepida TaxID=2973512 RepID=A0AA86T4Z9_9BACT|nr:ATP-binding protein [Nitrospira tepida]CAI4030457.1 ATP-binding protein [Nitrospira tepida]